MLRQGYVPIRGWPARVIEVIDDSGLWHKDKNKVDQVTGELRLHPKWNTEWVEFTGQETTLNLSAFFRCQAGNLPQRLIEAGKGALIIITGELTERQWKGEYPHLETMCWIDDFLVDNTGGKISPVAAQLLVADKREYTAAV